MFACELRRRLNGLRDLATALTAESKRFFQVLDVNWRSLESGDFWYKSRQFKKTVFSRALSISRIEHEKH